MKDLNVVVLTGNLTRDAERRNTQNGYFFAFTVACKLSVKKSDGSFDEKAIFRNVSYFSKTDRVGELLKKGTKVCINGFMDTDEYTGRDGENKKKDYIKADLVQVFGNKPKEEPAPAPVENFADDDFDFDSPVF